MKVTIIPANKSDQSDENGKYQKLRVAAYCRVSTAQEEQQNSYQVQIDYYTSYIGKNKDWKLAGIFADEGISGTQTKKRTEFNRMIRLCKKKKIDLVLCKSISRFARNTVDCLEYVRQLKELGIAVIFEKENINTLTMTSEFMITLYGSFAQAESESISKNVQWGVEKGFREGRVRYNFTKLLGYRKGPDGKPEIIPEEASIVKEIFKLYLDGMSTQGIADLLDMRNVPTKTGRPKWCKTTVLAVLKNEKYVGDALLQKTYTIDCITHKRGKNNGERPKYLVTDVHEPIIDRDTFNRTQQEMERRASKKNKSDKGKTELGRYSSKYALTDIMICGECGYAYKRITWYGIGKRKGERIIVWRCINRIDHGKRFCHKSPSVNEEKLHRAIVKAINEYYGNGDDIRRIMQGSLEAVLAGSDNSGLRKAEIRLSEIDKARNDYISLITAGTMSEDSMDTEFQKLYEEEIELNEKIADLKKQDVISQEQKNQLDLAIKDIIDEPCKLIEYDDVLTRKLIECIKVINDSEIIVTFKGGHEMSVELEK